MHPVVLKLFRKSPDTAHGIVVKESPLNKYPLTHLGKRLMIILIPAESEAQSFSIFHANKF